MRPSGRRSNTWGATGRSTTISRRRCGLGKTGGCFVPRNARWDSYNNFSRTMKFSEKFIRSLPKALLHDHLDGGLRPKTVIELARDIGYDKLPTTDPGELAEWFHRGAQRGSLPLYLEGFAHTTGVRPTKR